MFWKELVFEHFHFSWQVAIREIRTWAIANIIINSYNIFSRVRDFELPNWIQHSLFQKNSMIPQSLDDSEYTQLSSKLRRPLFSQFLQLGLNSKSAATPRRIHHIYKQEYMLLCRKFRSSVHQYFLLFCFRILV